MGALAFGVQATENRWTLDGGRTIGWELADQMASDPAAHVWCRWRGSAADIGWALACSRPRLGASRSCPGFGQFKPRAARRSIGLGAP